MNAEQNGTAEKGPTRLVSKEISFYNACLLAEEGIASNVFSTVVWHRDITAVRTAIFDKKFVTVATPYTEICSLVA